MRGVSTCVAALVASLVAFSSCDAFVVTNGSVTPMDPTDVNRVLQQSYHVDQPIMDNLFGSHSIQTLKISVPGRVFVSNSYGLSFGSDGARNLATVRFSGNSEEIFKYFEVISTAPNTVEVRRRPDVHGRLHDAYMLTEISLSSAHQISQLITSGSADVIVEDLVLVSDGRTPLKLQLSGSGNVYVNSKLSDFVPSVSVESSGSGDLKWLVGSLQTQSFTLSVTGSGDVTLMGDDIKTAAIKVDIAGSGDICVDAPRIETNTLFSSTVGSGTTSFSSASGQCNHEDISILGAGDVYLGSMQCKDVKITIAGAGDIYVQAVHSISGTAWGAGDVKYVGVTPELISDRYDANVFSDAGNTHKHSEYHPIARQKLKNKASTCHIDAFPPRIAVHVKSSFWEASVGSVSSVLGPLVFFALLSLCYLRRQMKPHRRGRSERRDPRFAAYPPPLQAHEMQPLTQQVPQTQVYV